MSIPALGACLASVASVLHAALTTCSRHTHHGQVLQVQDTRLFPHVFRWRRLCTGRIADLDERVLADEHKEIILQFCDQRFVDAHYLSQDAVHHSLHTFSASMSYLRHFASM